MFSVTFDYNALSSFYSSGAGFSVSTQRAIFNASFAVKLGVREGSGAVAQRTILKVIPGCRFRSSDGVLLQLTKFPGGKSVIEEPGVKHTAAEVGAFGWATSCMPPADDEG